MSYIIQNETVADIADAIRLKGGIEGEIKVEDFAQSIRELSTSTDGQEIKNAVESAKASAAEAKKSAESAASSATVVKYATDAEAARVRAENARVAAENIRVESENERIENENTRKSNEDTRISAEENRKAAEDGRVTAEAARVTAEQERVDENNGIVARATEKSIEAQLWASEIDYITTYSGVARSGSSGIQSYSNRKLINGAVYTFTADGANGKESKDVKYDSGTLDLTVGYVKFSYSPGYAIRAVATNDNPSQNVEFSVKLKNIEFSGTSAKESAKKAENMKKNASGFSNLSLAYAEGLDGKFGFNVVLQDNIKNGVSISTGLAVGGTYIIGMSHSVAGIGAHSGSMMVKETEEVTVIAGKTGTVEVLHFTITYNENSITFSNGPSVSSDDKYTFSIRLIAPNSVSNIPTTSAKKYCEDAGVSETHANTSASAAATSETNAKASEGAAKVSETNAKNSENKAKASETASAASQAAAKASEDNAKSSEDKAKVSEANAKTSETNAKDSETKAKDSETQAKDSETKAKTSETNSKTSETNAKTSEVNSKASETASANSQSAAATSEANAKTSETKAKTSEDNAKASETASSNSKKAAALSETHAAASEANARVSESNAANSAKTAEAWAVGTKGGVALTEGDQFENNAKYWAEVSKTVSGLDIFTNAEIEDIYNAI